jgi:hypothetical protein
MYVSAFTFKEVNIENKAQRGGNRGKKKGKKFFNSVDVAVIEALDILIM